MTNKQEIIDRFLGYVKIDTQSDETSEATPSTEKQWNLANQLTAELKEMGMQDVSIDENAYVMATLPSNVDVRGSGNWVCLTFRYHSRFYRN